jgi:hypothetical protein
VSGVGRIALAPVAKRSVVRDPLDVLKAFENGIENVVSFLAEGITAQQLEQLASLMDEKKIDTLSLF